MDGYIRRPTEAFEETKAPKCRNLVGRIRDQPLPLAELYSHVVAINACNFLSTLLTLKAFFLLCLKNCEPQRSCVPKTYRHHIKGYVWSSLCPAKWEAWKLADGVQVSGFSYKGTHTPTKIGLRLTIDKIYKIQWFGYLSHVMMMSAYAYN